MYVLTYRIDFGHRGDDSIAEVVGVRTGEPNAAHAVDGTKRAQPLREIILSVVICIHRLSQQYDFGHAFGDDSAHLSHDVGQSTAALGPSRRRNDAIRALVIAAPL